jgi:XTP/dITP diphosphohydrolase
LDAPALVIATGNRGKIKEIRLLLADLGIKLKTPVDFPECPEVTEDQDTFEANAAKKAKLIASCTGFAALADDSGLEVDALGGRPGVHSARYALDRTAPARPTDPDNYLKLLDEMAPVPWEERRARFVCCMVVAFPGGKTAVARGTCPGFINLEPRGEDGFGYDPVFWLPEYQKTMAEVGLVIKNQISHRAQALKQLKATLAQILSQEPSLLQPAKEIGT